MRNAFARADCKLQPGLQIKEGHRSMLELCTNDALRFQAKAITIEPKRPFQVINADGDDGDSSFHARVLSKTRWNSARAAPPMPVRITMSDRARCATRPRCSPIFP